MSLIDFIFSIFRRTPFQGCPFEDIAEQEHMPLRIVDAYDRPIVFSI